MIASVDTAALASMLLGPMTTGAAAAAALLAGVAALTLRRRLRASEAERAQAESWARLYRRLSHSAPDGYFLWLHAPENGGEADEDIQSCSARLAVLLELPGGTAAAYADIAACFGAEEAAVLDVAVEGLRRNGIPFDLDLMLAASLRTIHVMGRRLGEGGERVRADVLWMRDVTSVQDMESEPGDEDLAVSERDRLRAVLDAVPVPVWLRDEDLSLLMCNAAYVAAVGASDPEEALETELAGNVSARQARALAARARAAEAARAETLHTVVDGVRRLMELTECPVTVPGPDGPRRCTVGIAVDVTRLEEAQSHLARQTAAHAEVLERLGTAIAVFGPDTRLTFHNSAFAALWRLDPEWLAGAPAYGQVLEALRETRRLPETADFPAFKDEELKRFTALIEPREDLLHLPDGTTLRRVLSPHPTGGLLATFENVTDRLALETSYNTLIAVQRETLDHLQEAVAVFDEQGRLRLSNPAFAELWRLSETELDALPHFRDLIEFHRPFFPAETWSDFRDALIEALAGRQARRGRADRADGVRVAHAAVPLPDGGMVLTYFNVTDAAQVERALRERNEALRAANRMRAEFIANVSFELRTPLTGLVGFAEALAGGYCGPLDDRQGDYVRAILDSAQAMAALVADITDMAAVDAGRLAPARAAVDVHALLTAIAGEAREAAMRKDIRLALDCPPDIGWITGDESLLRRALSHLMRNALAFTPKGGAVTLSAARRDDAVALTVEDTGIGIPESDQDPIFEPFHRGAAAPPGGAGLGLTVVRRLTELHRGRVRIESAPGRGTRVTCTLPVGAPLKPAPEEATAK